MGKLGGNSQDIAPTLPIAPAPAPKPIPSAPVAVTMGLKNVCPGDTTILGVDVSHYQPQVAWTKLKASGVQFAFIKATEGASAMDPSFEMHWQNAKAAGVLRGAYHFFHPSADPVSQARNFCATMGKLDALDLPPVMDWEVTDGEPAASDLANGKIFLEEVERISGRKPIIYSGPYFMQEMGVTVTFAQYPLWIAHYTNKCPLVPFPWAQWAFWQNSGGASVPGVVGACDTDMFNGTLSDLHAFIQKSQIVG